jgi:hypothetical protein
MAACCAHKPIRHYEFASRKKTTEMQQMLQEVIRSLKEPGGSSLHAKKK